MKEIGFIVCIVTMLFVPMKVNGQNNNLPDSIFKKYDIQSFSQNWKNGSYKFRGDTVARDLKKDTAYFKNGLNIANYTIKQVITLLGKPNKNIDDKNEKILAYYISDGYCFTDDHHSHKWVLEIHFVKDKVIKMDEHVITVK